MLGGGGDPAAAVNLELVLLSGSPPSDLLWLAMPTSSDSVLARALPVRDVLREREPESRSGLRPRPPPSCEELLLLAERDEGDPKVIARMTAAAMRCCSVVWGRGERSGTRWVGCVPVLAVIAKWRREDPKGGDAEHAG